MKKMKCMYLVGLSLIALLFPPAAARAATEELSLEDQLQRLSLPENQAPVGLSSEKLYAVQNRFAGLKGKSEFNLSGAIDLTPDSFISTREASFTYRYHLSDRWNIALGASKVFNDLSAAGERLLELNERLPDVDYVKDRQELLVGFNAFYGKFRLNMDNVLYFDQYVALGPSLINLSSGRAPAGVADVGLAFWFGKRWTARFGFKDYFYREERALGGGMTHHLFTHLDVGILLGGEK